MRPERLDRIDRLAIGLGAVAIGVIALAAARHTRVLAVTDPAPALERCAALVTTEVPGARPVAEESFAWVDWDRSDPTHLRGGLTRTYAHSENPPPLDQPHTWQVRLVVDERDPSDEVVRSYHHCELEHDPRSGAWRPRSVGPVLP